MQKKIPGLFIRCENPQTDSHKTVQSYHQFSVLVGHPCMFCCW